MRTSSSGPTSGQGGPHPCKRGFAAYHENGTNFVMCDGSVRFIQNAVDINILAAMATIARSAGIASWLMISLAKAAVREARAASNAMPRDRK